MKTRYEVQVHESVTKTYYVVLPADNDDDALEAFEELDWSKLPVANTEVHGCEVVFVEERPWNPEG